MIRLSISEEEKDDILDKYNQSVDDNVFIYLRRHFPIWDKEFEGIGKYKYIKIDDKSYVLQGNKQYLTKKLKLFIEDTFPDVSEPVLIRTIRKFISTLLEN